MRVTECARKNEENILSFSFALSVAHLCTTEDGLPDRPAFAGLRGARVKTNVQIDVHCHESCPGGRTERFLLDGLAAKSISYKFIFMG